METLPTDLETKLDMFEEILDLPPKANNVDLITISRKLASLMDHERHMELLRMLLKNILAAKNSEDMERDHLLRAILFVLRKSYGYAGAIQEEESENKKLLTMLVSLAREQNIKQAA